MSEHDKFWLPKEIKESFIKQRKIFLWSQIMDDVAEYTVKQLLHMDSVSNEEITMYINSPGGVITSGLAIYDCMKAIRSPVATVVCGQAASMGSFLLAVGTKGRRYAWPRARVMIHQPLISGQMWGPASDIEIHAEEMQKTKNFLNSVYAEVTGKTIEQVVADTERDHFLSADDSLKYGLVDKVEFKI